MIKQIYRIALRECGILRSNPIYAFCMVVFPVLVVVFFTSLMTEGQPVNMPVGVVDQDNTATTRALIRRLDAFQTTKVVAHYANINDARRAVQEGDVFSQIAPLSGYFFLICIPNEGNLPNFLEKIV